MPNQELNRQALPEPVFDEHPQLVDFYYRAWELAWNNVKNYDGVPVSPLMKEGFAHDRLWIWDTCLMAHFCKYAPDLFPGIESLDNFYAPLHDGVPTAMKIHHPDNPPLFAWTEYEYFKITGDRCRIEHLLHDKQYLQKHFRFMETLDSGSLVSAGIQHTNFKKLSHGYMWSGNPSGMDNTPRGHLYYDAMLWLDAAAQQALSALYIARLAAVLNDENVEAEYLRHYGQLKELLNRYYWDEEDGCYYDIRICNLERMKVLTPASFWPLLAEIATPEQAVRQSKVLSDPELLGGLVPCPSVARNSTYFQPTGRYWLGGVWLPTSYMTIKAIEKYGMFELASEVAEKTLHHMYETYCNYTPSTIWECYSPTAAEPADNKVGKIVRPDFCGWSALGPISMLIENVLGFHQLDAATTTVYWHPRHNGRHGIKNLRLGTNRIDLVKNDSTIEVNCTQPFTLILSDKTYQLEAGASMLAVD